MRIDINKVKVFSILYLFHQGITLLLPSVIHLLEYSSKSTELNDTSVLFHHGGLNLE